MTPNALSVVPTPYTPTAHTPGRYDAVRRTTCELAAPLSAEDCQVQSMPDCSPVKWHLGHTTWFFETFVLAAHQPGYRAFHEQFRMIFNSYYNAIGAKHPRPERGLLSRPALCEVMAYREHVDQAMRDLLAYRDGVDPSLAALIELGLNHEQQHQELILTDTKHMLWCNPLKPAYCPRPPAPAASSAGPASWVRFDGAIARIGHQTDGFSFDNERPAHEVLLRPYYLASRLVTQGEYLEFILDGGYRRPELWLSLGWDAVSAYDWSAPLYWDNEHDTWRTYTLYGMKTLNPDAPVSHLSYFEADAYARWAQARLPREAEWEHAARLQEPEGPGTSANFLDAGHLEPRAAQPASSGAPLAQLSGDVWEWTCSAYDAYPGYMPPQGAVGEYNGKFMCNQYVLRGGSCVTPANHIRASYRNFFPPQARWQYAGLRLARDA